MRRYAANGGGRDIALGMTTSAELLWMLALHLLLTGLPALAAALFAARRGVAGAPLLLAVALAASGCAAMLGFWSFYAAPELGQTVAFLIAFGSAAAIAWLWRAGIEREVLAELWPPLALWALASAFVVYLGFLHGGSAEPLTMATLRFSHQLPTDNEIPRYFADYFYLHGHTGTPPPFADWLSSDRPPLQIGYVLSQRPFAWDSSGLQYEVMGVVVQQLWILGMWAVLCAARVRPLPRAVAIAAAVLSDVAIVHAFFIWPKLIAAAFSLAALAIVLSPQWESLRRNLWAAALFAALCGLSMLAHGSSAFFLLPLLGFAALRGLPSWRWLGVAVLAGFVLLAPWSAYQRYADPPGDRLVKWQLGGSLAIDDRSALGTIAEGYEEAGFDGTLENKWRNVRQIVGEEQTKQALEEARTYLSEGHPGMAIAALRLPRFFALLPFLGILLIGPLAMLLARIRGPRAGPEWSFAVTALALCLAACVVWALLMFGSAEADTMIHVGSLAVPLLAVCGCVLGAYAVSPRLGIGLAAVNVLIVLVMYTPSLSPLPGTSYSPLAGLLAAASLAGFLAVAFGPPLRGAR